MNLNLKQLNFQNRSVLTVGDVMLDQYVLGSVDRISPEAPIPIFTQSEIKSTLGGSGNVSKNIHTLGAKSILLALVGQDKTGEKIQKLCTENSIELHYIKDESRPTTCKKRFIAKNQQIMRLDEESIDLISDSILEKSITSFDMLVGRSNLDAIIIQDYNKGFLHPKLIKHIIAAANEKQIVTIVDPKFKNLSAYNNCSAIKPNQKEISQALNRKVSTSIEDLKSAVEELKKLISFDKIYVTLGSEGIYNYQNNQISKGYDIEVVDITGAGDSVVSMLALLLADNVEEDIICPILNIIGNLACRTQGAYGVGIEELRGFIKS